MMNAPFFLKEYTKNINELPGFKHQNWFKDLSWAGQLYVDDNYIFSIYYEGLKCDDHSIINDDDSPLIIFAEEMFHNKRILLFDEEIHGYAPLLIEKIIFTKRGIENIYTDKNNNSLFEVFIWSNTSVDFEDEFKFNEYNETKLLNGENVNLQYLKSNAFDAFGIILRDKNGEYIHLLEMELS